MSVFTAPLEIDRITITTEKGLEIAEMIENKYVWHALSELETNALFFVDTEGVVRDINKGVTAILGYSADEIVGRPIECFLHQGSRKIHRSAFSHYISRRKNNEHPRSKLIGAQRIFPSTVTVEASKPIRFSVIKSDQQEIPVTLTINEVLSDSDNLAGFIAIIRDNAEQYNLLKMLQYKATYDELTGLINWPEFVHKVHIAQKVRSKKDCEFHAVVLFLDIDYFKTITYRSQKAGDYAIQKAATWLLNTTRQAGNRSLDLVVSRFVGDEFILYLPDTILDSALVLARRLQSEFRHLNFRTDEHPFHSSISIGLAEITPSSNLQDAVSKASSACLLAKKKGKDKIKVAEEEDTRYQKLEPIIRHALQNQGLKLYAQKIVAISSSAKKIDNGRFHYEVLSRMEDQHGNIISPLAFIPAAEKLGLATAIDMYVVKHVLDTLQSNFEHEASLSVCSINLSGISVSNEHMLPFIESCLLKSGIDPGKVCFEVTETYEIQDNDTATHLVTKLREMGCKFAFDDFGIGYSNYQSFSRLPVDIIKIDGSYIQHILQNGQLKTDVEGMISSAKSRGLEIVAEYAENKAIVEELERLGVDYAQGYYFGRPIPLNRLINAQRI